MLLIFEDGNGNLIQFSRNRVTTIPAFFKECTYSSVSEFTSKDYPNFFKVNHYKKQKEEEDDDGTLQEEMPPEEFAAESDPVAPSYVETAPSIKIFNKRSSLAKPSRARDEGYLTDHMIYHSGSEDSSHDGGEETRPFPEPQIREPYYNQPKPVPVMMSKPRIQRQEENVKPMIHEQEVSRPYINEQEIVPIFPRESFQSFREVPQRMIEDKSMEYPPQYMSYQPPFKRPSPQGESGPLYRYYAPENSMPQSMNPNYPRDPNFPTHSHNVQSYQNGPAEYSYPVKNSRPKNFANAPMNNNTQSEEALNNMFRFPQANYHKAMHPQSNGRIISKAEMDEKILGTANMMKYVNNSATNTYAGQKIYNFYSSENGKPEETEVMPDPPTIRTRTRSEYEAGPYETEPDYSEFNHYYRGEYRPENNLPANLPAAYFSSKKFNFEGYFSTFEDDRFNEFADPKKKLKQ
jgi:hypothetical protein